MLARDEIVLDLERKIERFLGLGILPKLQMGIDEIIERVDAILGRTPVCLRGFRRVVRRVLTLRRRVARVVRGCDRRTVQRMTDPWQRGS